MKIFEVLNIFGTDEKCLLFLIENNYIFCKQHKTAKLYIKINKLACCILCKASVGVDEKSILFKTKGSYEYWFMCLYNFWYSRNGLTSIQLNKIIDVSLKVSWNMLKE